MNTNLRGLQLFRQLCWQSDLGLSANAASARLDPVNHWIALRRSFSAQPAANLTSESPHVDDQQAMRQASVVAHESLLQALQQLINESRQDGFMFEEAKGSRVKQRELQRRRILEGFAPMKLLLSRNEGLEGIADQRVAAKWLKQIALECAQIDKLRKQYEKEAAQLKKVGKGSLVGPSTSMMQSWYDPLLQAIRKEHEAVSIAPPAPTCATIHACLRELLSPSSQSSVSWTWLHTHVL